MVDCKPEDKICVVEADIEVDFKPPLDYKEIPLTKKKSHFVIDEDEEKMKKLKELEKKHVRLDGKGLSEKQKQELLKKHEEEVKKEEDFDPRKHRLTHGIRNYKDGSLKFEGKGVKAK